MPGPAYKHLFESPVAQVLVQDLALRIARLGLQLLDLGIDVAIAQQNVGPAIVVVVDEAATPAEILRMYAQSRLERCVLKVPLAEIVIQRRRVAREVSLHNVEIAVEIVIGGRDAHAGLRLAVGAEARTRPPCQRPRSGRRACSGTAR